MKARILPFMEQTAVCNAFNQSFDFNAAAERRRPARRRSRTFLCPSDSNTVQRVGSSYNGRDFGDTNYYNNLGNPALAQRRSLRRPRLHHGSQPTARRHAWRAITDGTSNTAIFSESLMGNSSSGPNPSSAGISGQRVDLHHDDHRHDHPPAPPNLGSLAGQPAIHQPDLLPGVDGQAQRFQDQRLFLGQLGNGEGGGYSHVQTPNQRNCWGNNQDTASPNALGRQPVPVRQHAHRQVEPLRRASTWRFLDGSVKFIKNSVNPGTYGALGTRPGARSSTPAATEKSGIRPRN